MGTAGEVKVAISHGTSAKNLALDVKVKCQKKIAKLTPEIMRIRLGEGVLGRQNQDPKKDTKLNQKKEKSEGGVLGVWREGRGSWEMTKSSTRICKVIQHALHPLRGAANRNYCTTHPARHRRPLGVWQLRLATSCSKERLDIDKMDQHM